MRPLPPTCVSAVWRQTPLFNSMIHSLRFPTLRVCTPSSQVYSIQTATLAVKSTPHVVSGFMYNIPQRHQVLERSIPSASELYSRNLWYASSLHRSVYSSCMEIFTSHSIFPLVLLIGIVLPVVVVILFVTFITPSKTVTITEERIQNTTSYDFVLLSILRLDIWNSLTPKDSSPPSSKMIVIQRRYQPRHLLDLLMESNPSPTPLLLNTKPNTI